LRKAPNTAHKFFFTWLNVNMSSELMSPSKAFAGDMWKKKQAEPAKGST
jgi:hypothetical protein